MSDEVCRICRDSAEPDRPLYHPCKCSGSIRFVHQDCLQEWLAQSRSSSCQLCNHKFVFRPLYKDGEAERLPLGAVFRAFVELCGPPILHWSRYLFVSLVWVWLLPMVARYSFRAQFEDWSVPWEADDPLAHLGMDWLVGAGICAAIVAVLFTLLIYRDFVIMQFRDPDPFALPGPEEVMDFLAEEAMEAAQRQRAAQRGRDRWNEAPREAGNGNDDDTGQGDEDVANAYGLDSCSDLTTLLNGRLSPRSSASASDDEEEHSSSSSSSSSDASPNSSDNEHDEHDDDDEEEEEEEEDHNQGRGAGMRGWGGATAFAGNQHQGLRYRGQRDAQGPDARGAHGGANHAADALGGGGGGGGESDSDADSDALGPDDWLPGDEFPQDADEDNNGAVNNNGNDAAMFGWENDPFAEEPVEVPMLEQLGFQGPMHRMWETFLWIAFALIVLLLTLGFVPLSVGTTVLWAFVGANPPPLAGLALGYLLLGSAVMLVARHGSAVQRMMARRWSRFLGSYFKVYGCMAVEIGALPVLVGGIIDVAVLPLQGSTLAEHKQLIDNAPFTFSIVLAVLGILFMQYFSTCVLAMRDKLNPGVLWFFRDPLEPGFHPFIPLTQNTILKSMVRLLVVTAMYILTVAFVVWLPSVLTAWLFPSLVPLNLFIRHPFELVWCLWALPRFLDALEMSSVLMDTFLVWVRLVSPFFGLRETLLPPPNVRREDMEEPNPRSLLNYTREGVIRGVSFTLAGLVGLSLATTLCLGIPVSVGRFLISLVTSLKLHDAVCLYAGIAALRGAAALIGYVAHMPATRLVADVSRRAPVVLMEVAVAFVLHVALPLVVGRHVVAIIQAFSFPTHSSWLLATVVEWATGYIVSATVPVLSFAADLQRWQEEGIIHGSPEYRLLCTLKYVLPCVLMVGAFHLAMHGLFFGVLPLFGFSGYLCIYMQLAILGAFSVNLVNFLAVRRYRGQVFEFLERVKQRHNLAGVQLENA